MKYSKQININILVLASLTAVMHNPKNYPEPELFKPERFLKDGEFIHDPKVCPFSLGLRNCIGQKLARLEYFTFAADVINNYRFEVFEVFAIHNYFCYTPDCYTPDEQNDRMNIFAMPYL